MNIFAFGQKTVKIKLNGKEIAGREVILPLPPSVNQKTTVYWSAIKNQFAGVITLVFVQRKAVLRIQPHITDGSMQHVVFYVKVICL